jgi:hypothetical protein
LLFNIVSEDAIRKLDENQEGLKLNGTYEPLVYADDINILGKIINTVKNRVDICGIGMCASG